MPASHLLFSFFFLLVMTGAVVPFGGENVPPVGKGTNRRVSRRASSSGAQKEERFGVAANLPDAPAYVARNRAQRPRGSLPGERVVCVY